MTKLVASLLIVLIATLVAPALPAFAIDDPDSEPSINAVDVYENCLEDGDVGVLIDYYLDYANLPTETATDAYMAVFVDTDEVTQLKTAAPYTYQDNGYGRGLVWLYFTAAEAATLDSALADDYRIWLTGNPTLNWTTATATTAMDGAIWDNGGALTDQTVASNNIAANDMTLLDAAPVIDDAYYFGGDDPFDLLTINIGTKGEGTWEIVWEYWNGTAWATLAGISDGTLAFEAATGNRDVSWTLPADWATTLVDTITTYWVRARVSSYTAIVTQPLGTQSWINSSSAPPKTITTIDQWSTVGDPSSLIALAVRGYANILELEWSLDLLDETALTSYGEAYFTNVITDLRTIAPSVFSSREFDPTYVPVTYDTAFGATATSGTADIVGTPVTLTPKIRLANPGFEVDNPPAVWTLVGNTDAMFSRSTVQVHDGTYSGLLTRYGADCHTYQSVNPADHLGNDIILGAWVYASVANRARIALDDETAAIGYSAYHSGVAGWEWLTVTYTVGAVVTDLQVRCYVDTGDTFAYFDNVALIEDVNLIDTGITVGTVIIDLAGWTFGAITDVTGTVTGSPLPLTPGVNTVVVTGAGTFTVEVAVVDTVTIRDDAIAGTGLDLTDLGIAFGMSRWEVSSIVWMLITGILCAAVYRGTSRGLSSASGGQSVMYVFAVAVIGGWLLGLLHPLVGSLLVICCGAFIGYVLFFRSEGLHKGFMFMAWMFLIVSIAGNFAASGTSGLTATYLTAAVTATEEQTINVASTEGFSDAGFVTIGDEIIGYPDTTDTTFERSSFAGVTTNPLLRGEEDTEAVVHYAGATVRTREAGFMNSAVDYRIARIADTTGLMDFIALPFHLMSLLMQFFTLPLSFLGTDLAVLSYVWMVVAMGMIVGFALQVLGGRRV